MPPNKLQTDGERTLTGQRRQERNRAPPRVQERGAPSRSCAEEDFLVKVSTLLGYVRSIELVVQRAKLGPLRYPQKPHTSTAVCSLCWQVRSHTVHQQDMAHPLVSRGAAAHRWLHVCIGMHVGMSSQASRCVACRNE